MSPPCQPFTTTKDSKQLQSKDPRNKAFVHLMKSLASMENKPSWIFLENVKGFATSDAHVEWTDTLRAAGYSWRQYLLTPFHFRVPNNRMRFYMVIRLDSVCPGGGVKGGGEGACGSELDGFTKDPTVMHSDIRQCSCNPLASHPFSSSPLPQGSDDTRTCPRNGDTSDSSSLHREALDSSYISFGDTPLHKLHELGEDGITGPEGVHSLSQYLAEDIDGEEMKELLVPDKVLQKRWSAGLSFVGREDRCSFCFTSSYGQVRIKMKCVMACVS